MKFIEPSVEIIKQAPGLEGVYKMIELAGRTAYKSEDKITEDSAKKFVDMLVGRNHGAALEHGTVYLRYMIGSPVEDSYYLIHTQDVIVFKNNPYSVVRSFNFSTANSTTDLYIRNYINCCGPTTVYYITTNYRVILENFEEKVIHHILDHMVDEPYPEHEQRITAKFICGRGISHELVRHRVFSFLQESTRYCNYSKDKFGGLTFIIPRWIHKIQVNTIASVDTLTGLQKVEFAAYKGDDLMGMLSCEDRTVSEYIDTLQKIEDCYLDMTTLDDGTKLVPQEAREILPNCLKTEIVMTGTISQWEEFFKLRRATNAHPDMQHLANNLYNQFINNNYLC